MSRIRLNPVLTSFFLVLFACIPAPAQQGGVGSIIGELHVSRGDFPSRVFVELQFRGATMASTYCDEEGKFGFTSLQSNPYRIVIHDERFNPVDQLIVLDTTISTMSIAQVTLTLREPTSAEALSNRQAGVNPNLVDPSEYRRHFPKGAVKEFDRGVESDRKGNREDAIVHYQNAIKMAPDFYHAHNNLGSDFLAKADLQSAQAQFEDAIKLNQSDAQAHLNLADVFLQMKQYDQGLSAVQEGLRRDPNSSFGHFILGSIYGRLSKYPDCEHELRQALQLDPKMSRVHLALVNLYLQQKRTPDAVSELKSFLQQAPKDPMASHAREVLQKLEAQSARGSD